MSDDCSLLDVYNSSFLSEYLQVGKWAVENKMPMSLTIELTPYCNFNCPMCYVHLTPGQAKEKGQHLTAAQWLEIIRQFVDLGLLMVNISGGEPMLRPDFWEIYEGISEMGVVTNVFSNGYLIDEKVVERFKQYPPHRIKLSLYGGCDETYEKMCGVKHGFTRFCRAVDLLREAEIPFYVTSCIVKQNVEDVPLMREFAETKKVRVNVSSAIASSTRGADTDPTGSRLDPAAAVAAMTPEAIKKAKHKPVKSLFECCGSYGRSGTITWNGHLQHCTYNENEFIALTEPYRIEDAWKHLWEMADAIKLPVECASCPDAEFCHTCPGVMASDSGYMDRISPDICRKAALIHKRYDEIMASEAQNAETGDKE